MYSSRFLALLVFVCCGIMSRFLPHPPNFTAMNSIALLSACYLPHVRLPLMIVMIIMFLSDLIIGLHMTMPFVYVSFCLTAYLAKKIHSRYSLNGVFASVPISSILFFFITNFGVWIVTDFYSKTWAGLGLCYFSAIPFLLNQLLGDCCYSLLFFAGFRFIEHILAKENRFMELAVYSK